MPYFVYKLHPKQSATPHNGTYEERVLESHVAYLESLLGQGSLVVAGTMTFNQSSDGLIILRAASEEQARKLMEADPLVLAGLADAQLGSFKLELLTTQHHSLPK